MVREIISIGVGQCGVNMMQTHYEAMLREHNLGFDGYSQDKTGPHKHLSTYTNESNPSVYFSENIDGSMSARALLVDLDSQSINNARSSSLARIFDPSSFLSHRYTARNNWCEGQYGIGNEMIDEIIDGVRKRIEEADSCFGFHFAHSLSGGTGSGLGSKIISQINEHYFKKIFMAFTVLPTLDSEIVVSAYNAILSMPTLIEFITLVNFVSNDAVSSMLDIENPGGKHDYAKVNEVVQRSVSAITASMRFPGGCNGDLRKLAINLCPFLRQHFISASYARVSLSSTTRRTPTEITRELISSLHDERNSISGTKSREGKTLTSATIFRGPLSPLLCAHELHRHTAINSHYQASMTASHLHLHRHTAINSHYQASI